MILISSSRQPFEVIRVILNYFLWFGGELELLIKIIQCRTAPHHRLSSIRIKPGSSRGFTVRRRFAASNKESFAFGLANLPRSLWVSVYVFFSVMSIISTSRLDFYWASLRKVAKGPTVKTRFMMRAGKRCSSVLLCSFAAMRFLLWA